MFDNALVALLFFSLFVLARRKRWSPVFRWLVRFGLHGITLLGCLAVPIGPEDRSVRRRPWVTYAVAGLCLAVFLLQLILAPGPGWDTELARARREATAYAYEHPYLKESPFLRAYWDRDALGLVVEKIRWRAPDHTTTALEQIELDHRTDRISDVLRRRPEYRWANVAAFSTWATKLRAAFVHDGWVHLLGNLLFLIAFAPFIEDVYGRLLFAILYLSSAIAGGVAENAHVASYTYSIGSSGAISGVMGAYLVRFGRRRLVLLGIPSLWLPMLRVRMSIPAYGFLLLFLAGNIAGAVSRAPGIGWWAHLGGFANGVFFALLLRLTKVEKYVVDPGIEARISFRQHPAVVKSFALRTRGRFESALRAVEAALVEQPQNVSVLREAYDASVAAGHLDRAGAHATRVLGMLATRSAPVDLKEAVLFVEEARTALGSAVPARFYFAAGDCLERQGQTAEAMRLYDGLVGHADAAIARRVAARRERLLRKLGGRGWRGRVVSRGTGTVQPAWARSFVAASRRAADPLRRGVTVR